MLFLPHDIRVATARFEQETGQQPASVWREVGHVRCLITPRLTPDEEDNYDRRYDVLMAGDAASLFEGTASFTLTSDPDIITNTDIRLFPSRRHPERNPLPDTVLRLDVERFINYGPNVYLRCRGVYEGMTIPPRSEPIINEGSGVAVLPPLEFGSATIADLALTTGESITPQTLPPVINKIDGVKYTLSGIPDGLHFNEGTRYFFGTPTTVQKRTLVYTASHHDYQDATLSFNAVVSDPAPPEPSKILVFTSTKTGPITAMPAAVDKIGEIDPYQSNSWDGVAIASAVRGNSYTYIVQAVRNDDFTAISRWQNSSRVPTFNDFNNNLSDYTKGANFTHEEVEYEYWYGSSTNYVGRRARLWVKR